MEQSPPSTPQPQRQFSRTQILFGQEAMQTLFQSRVAIFGLGGVGGYAAEALARSGIGGFDLIDNDSVSISNINRQIVATLDTIGKDKADLARERILSINADARVSVHKTFFLPQTADQFDFSEYDYIIDAVDTVSAKIQIIMQARAAGVRIISSMGTGNKMNPSLLQVADIYKTSVCPLARIMRRELKARGVKKLKVVFSTEKPLEHKEAATETKGAHPAPASTPFVPPVAGILIASEVVKDLLAMQPAAILSGRG